MLNTPKTANESNGAAKLLLDHSALALPTRIPASCRISSTSARPYLEYVLQTVKKSDPKA
jgi:hypothetical protein